jgi:hypothetical protein
MSVAPPSGQNRIMIYGPKNDGTYIVEFRTADGEALAISVPASETRVLKHFQERMPYGLFVPDVDADAIQSPELQDNARSSDGDVREELAAGMKEKPRACRGFEFRNKGESLEGRGLSRRPDTIPPHTNQARSGSHRRPDPPRACFLAVVWRPRAPFPFSWPRAP